MSSETIEIVEVEGRESLVVKDVVSTMKLGKVMGPAYQKIFDLIKKNSVECKSDDVPFCMYENIDWNEFDKKGIFSFFKMMFVKKWYLVMGIPIPENVEGEDGVENFTLPKGKYLKTVHRGSYMKVGKTYERLRDHANEEKFELKNFSIEEYMNDPREVSKDELITNVLIPII